MHTEREEENTTPLIGRFLGGFLSVIIATFLGGIVFSTPVSALFNPSLSVSVEQNSAIDGKFQLNSREQLTEYTSTLKVDANLKAGYLVNMSVETSNNALINTASGLQIPSIASVTTPAAFSTNSWGYKLATDNQYRPIPTSAQPETIVSTTGRIREEQSHQVNLGVFADDTLLSGDYTNKLVFSVIANPYDKSAVMMSGPDFFNLFDEHSELGGRSHQHFKEASALPDPTFSVFNIEDEDSDFEIKAWYDENDNGGTLYFYTTADKIYLNPNSSQLFKDASNMIDLEMAKFDTSLVTDMSDMFNTATSLESLDLSNFDTKNVTNMQGMFIYAGTLTELNLSHFDTSSVTDMSNMFSGCYSLTSIDTSNFNTARVENMSGMFSDMSSLAELDISGLNTSSLTNMSGMFNNLSGLTELDVTHFDTSKVIDMSNIFNGLSEVNELNLSNFDTHNVVNMSNMFGGMAKITELNLNNFNTSKVENMSGMFQGVGEVASLDLSHFDTSSVTDMSGMFSGMSNLSSVNTTGFDTSRVTNMADLFSSTTALTSIDISHFNTSSVENMSGMFSDAAGLTQINFGNNFNTEKVKNMSRMFKNATSLE